MSHKWDQAENDLLFQRKWVRSRVDGPDESKDKSERSNNVKVDGPKVLKLMGEIKLSF